MVSCAVPECNSRKEDKFTFHTFPVNVDIRKEWLKMLNRGSWVPRRYSTVCSKHFKYGCFSHRGIKRVKLKPGSIPTLFMPVPPRKCRPTSPPSQADHEFGNVTGESAITGFETTVDVKEEVMEYKDDVEFQNTLANQDTLSHTATEESYSYTPGDSLVHLYVQPSTSTQPIDRVMEDKLLKLQEELEGLKAINEFLKHENQTLTAENDSLTIEVKDLKERNLNLDLDYQKINEVNNTLSMNLQKLTEKNRSLKENIVNLLEKIRDLTKI